MKLNFASILLISTVAISLSNSAYGAPLTSFDFSADCDDCAGTISDGVFEAVTGELVLENFTPGVALVAENFVSFTYDGSSLLPSFTVGSDVLDSISGTLSNDGSLETRFRLLWMNAPPGSTSTCRIDVGPCFLDIQLDGRWAIDFDIDEYEEEEDDEDFGINATFSSATTVPLGGGSILFLLSVGLAGRFANVNAKGLR